ncbi:MAG: esterase-like activity of phytase family protein [Deltaproteobacteria bacterium]
MSRSGSFFISDEYGPNVFEFDRQGHLLQRLSVPEKFLIANPQSGADPDGNSLELYPGVNDAGRQANRGMEGLAITPNGRKLVGILQNALIQDHALNAETPPGRIGVNNRILSLDLARGAMREFVYVMDAINQGRGVNDLLALNDHEFLALERDNRSLVPTPPNAAQAPNLKRIYRFDLDQPGLTDVSNVASLPTTAAELGTNVPPIAAVTKTLFLDLLDPSYVIDATTEPPKTIKDVIAEKVEALSWGPDLPDGRHVLYVVTDNDLSPELPTQIYAFAIDDQAAGVCYQPQRVAGPMFPPGQLRRALE